MSESVSPEMKDCVRYVIVVHGIGEQRKNETVIKVINQFARARRGVTDDGLEVVSLGRASGSTGTQMDPMKRTADLPWIEFDGIPGKPAADGSIPSAFLGQLATTGENLRFVDFCWSDVMKDNAELVVEDVDRWAQSLIGRLKRKASVPAWVHRTLEVVADTAILVRFGMNFRFKEMKDLLFTQFLGDVQQYGEYPICRGRAVRRFHELMADVEHKHREMEKERGSSREARYTVIAHSLGTIMSTDALLYAHTTRELQCETTSIYPNLPFLGYLDKEDHELIKKSNFDNKALRFLDTDWIKRVDAFVTLGSPIDKYLIMWSQNYRYLLLDPSPPDSTGTQRRAWLPDPSKKIYHWNYSDEQDPVGHNLDVAVTAPAFKEVFCTCQDIVFNRYGVPGVAHNKYWQDDALFAWILRKAVDLEPSSSGAPEWFDVAEYKKLLLWIYAAAPMAVIGVTFYAFTLALQAEGVHSVVVSTAVFTLAAIFGRKLLDLSLWWRQIQRLKGKKQWRAFANTEEAESKSRAGYEACRLDEILARRDGLAKSASRDIYRSTVAVATIGGGIAGMHAVIWPDRWSWTGEMPIRLVLIFVIALATVFGYKRLVRLDDQYRTGKPIGVWTALTRGCMPVFLMVAIAVAVARWAPAWLAVPASWAPTWIMAVVSESGILYASAFFTVTTIVLAYRWARFRSIKLQLGECMEELDFSEYVRGG